MRRSYDLVVDDDLDERQNLWLQKVAENPGHSAAYAERFRRLAREGHDLAGEARMIDAMAARGARLLDAGCGTGRIGVFLHAAGHRVIGVDLDPELIEVARAENPGPDWRVGDLAGLDLPERFDIVYCAGNVLTFVAPRDRVEILRRFRGHLDDGGRVVTGFGAGRDYAFDDFLADAAAAGLTCEITLSTWDLRPFGDASDFLVAIFT